MVELELLGLHGDGEHLTLTDEDGRRYRVAIDDALRAAVRRDRPKLQHLPADPGEPLRPKDIQALIRAGASVAEVAERSGMEEARVRRYEGPVVAERTWVVQQAQNQRVGHEPDAPRLGDLVLDRLAARGVETRSLEWDAVRHPGGPWEVVATFVAGEREREARWEVDLGTRTLHAVDDEARWLSETEIGTSAHPRRHLSPRRCALPASLTSSRNRAARAPRAGPSSPARAGSVRRICSSTELHHARSSSAPTWAVGTRRWARSSTSPSRPRRAARRPGGSSRAAAGAPGRRGRAPSSGRRARRSAARAGRPCPRRNR
ncbi:septation protein SepH [Georgenia sp. SUBG003]|uniref:septation protein SepH n=1 Tax=Georgenia sp. SUBG003 TaxID=1497974 RepID=UPI003AB31550